MAVGGDVVELSEVRAGCEQFALLVGGVEPGVFSGGDAAEAAELLAG
jgi:hypothetical protein